MKDYSFEEHFEKYPLAMAYVPWQHFTKMYENLEKVGKDRELYL